MKLETLFSTNSTNPPSHRGPRLESIDAERARQHTAATVHVQAQQNQASQSIEFNLISGHQHHYHAELRRLCVVHTSLRFAPSNRMETLTTNLQTAKSVVDGGGVR